MVGFVVVGDFAVGDFGPVLTADGPIRRAGPSRSYNSAACGGVGNADTSMVSHSAQKGSVMGSSTMRSQGTLNIGTLQATR
jgi:hypothetical protein